MPRTVQFFAKHVYGKRELYPFNADAKKFAEIAGTKTLLPRHIDAMRDLGFAVEEVAPCADGSCVTVAKFDPSGIAANWRLPMTRAEEAAEAGRRG
jgi:hypothetical protein